MALTEGKDDSNMAKNYGSVEVGILAAGLAFIVWCLGKVSMFLETLEFAKQFIQGLLQCLFSPVKQCPWTFHRQVHQQMARISRLHGPQNSDVS